MKLAPFSMLGAVALLAASVCRAQSVSPGDRIRDIAAGSAALVVTPDGTVLFWGPDADGLAARAPSARRAITAPVVLNLPGNALQVALGESTAYALLENGTVFAWGTNDQGQLGNGAMGANGELGRYPKPSITPVQVTGLSDIIQIEAGAKHAVALSRDGIVWAWGQRSNGAIGDGAPTTARAVPAIGPTRVPGISGATQIATGRTHNLALTADGHVISWGSNGDGELGLGTRTATWMPSVVSGIDHVVAIAAGTGSMGKGVSGAVRDDGTAWMWGSNTSAQMGNGDEPLAPDDPGGRVLSPVQVKGLVGASRLTIASGHVAALLGDGTLRMWGFDGYGEIGVGTSGSYQRTPVKVTGLSGVSAVYLGGYHSFAVKTDGTLWMWGGEFIYGQGLLGKNLHVPTLLDLVALSQLP